MRRTSTPPRQRGVRYSTPHRASTCALRRLSRGDHQAPAALRTMLSLAANAEGREWAKGYVTPLGIGSGALIPSLWE